MCEQNRTTLNKAVTITIETPSSLSEESTPVISFGQDCCRVTAFIRICMKRTYVQKVVL